MSEMLLCGYRFFFLVSELTFKMISNHFQEREENEFFERHSKDSRKTGKNANTNNVFKSLVILNQHQRLSYHT